MQRRDGRAIEPFQGDEDSTAVRSVPYKPPALFSRVCRAKIESRRRRIAILDANNACPGDPLPTVNIIAAVVPATLGLATPSASGKARARPRCRLNVYKRPQLPPLAASLPLHFIFNNPLQGRSALQWTSITCSPLLAAGPPAGNLSLSRRSRESSREKVSPQHPLAGEKLS
jgi:hypothetical protein